MTSGGKREGAGRPALSPDTQRITITILPEDLAYLDRIDSNRSNAIRTLIKEHQAMTTQQARNLAISAIESVHKGDHQPVAEATIVGLNDSGYWVTDNGEEVNGLTREQAIDIIVENLANAD